MRKLITPLLLLAAISGAFGQSKPRKVIIHKSVTIHRDSVAYLPDTIACYFKELIMQPDTVYEKWNKGFIVWQTWNNPNIYASSNGTYGLTSSSIFLSTGVYKEPEPYENRYQFDQPIRGKFLYSDYKPVTNKVIYSIQK